MLMRLKSMRLRDLRLILTASVPLELLRSAVANLLVSQNSNLPASRQSQLIILSSTPQRSNGSVSGDLEVRGGVERCEEGGRGSRKKVEGFSRCQLGSWKIARYVEETANVEIQCFVPSSCVRVDRHCVVYDAYAFRIGRSLLTIGFVVVPMH